MLEWLEKPDGERPDFITLYFNEPDHVGHGSGPDSEQVGTILVKLKKLPASVDHGILFWHDMWLGTV